jgi:hypothetical protein
MDLTHNDFYSIITLMHSQELYTRLEAVRYAIAKLQDMQVSQIYKNCRILWDDLDAEYVQCRKYQKVTLKYTEIAEKLDTALVVLEQQLIFGTLLKT